MQIVLPLIILVFSISSSSAAAYVGYFRDPAHPGKCVLNDLILSPGDVLNDKEKCEMTSCEENGLGSYYSCGVYGLNDDCKFGGLKYSNSSYPDCCEHIIICNNIGEEIKVTTL